MLRTSVLSLLLALLLGWPAHEAMADTVLVLGDSISAAYGIQREQGWVALLEERLEALDPGHRVVNASVSGGTTAGGVARLPRALDTFDPDLVIVELGGNDGLRGYPLERIEANLTRLVELARQSDARVVLVGMEIPPNYGPRYANGFRDVFTTVADACDVELVPFLLDGIATVDALMQDDGIHPTAAAQERLLDNAWPFVHEALIQPN